MFSLIFALMMAASQAPPATQKPAPAPPPATAPAPAAPQQTAPAPAATTKPQTAPAPARKPAAAGSATLQVRVTDRSGSPAAEAAVSAEGPSPRSGSTDANGSLTLLVR